jgi:riboflavin biosynthesis pyrimidine reductase
MPVAEGKNVLRILPGPAENVPLPGLYLGERFGPTGARSQTCTYGNFIASLDGRISLPDPRTLKRTVPRDIANPRDWRLFQELAACADAVVTSGRYVRDLPSAVTGRSFPVSDKPAYADLLEWRRMRGLTPQPAVVIVTATVDLPPLGQLVDSGRAVYVATGSRVAPRAISRVESQGARVLRVGEGTRAEGGRLVEALAQEARWKIAMIGGGEVLHSLLADDVLDRLYLTLACRLLGGLSFDTLLTGAVLEPATRFKLAALHYDAASGAADVEQLFAILDRS